MISKIHFISQEPHLETIQKALNAGCNWIQLRIKDKPQEEVFKTALKAKEMCDVFNAKIIINDFPLIAKEINATGVHLGLTDMSIQEAKKLLPSTMIVGGTANTLEDVLLCINEKADYIGLGPLHFTTTKKDLSPILGFEGYRKIIQELKKRKLNLPLIAIGGVTEKDISELFNTGVYGIAFSNALIQNKDSKAMISNILNQM